MARGNHELTAIKTYKPIDEKNFFANKWSDWEIRQPVYRVLKMDQNKNIQIHKEYSTNDHVVSSKDKTHHGPSAVPGFAVMVSPMRASKIIKGNRMMTYRPYFRIK